MSLQSRVGVVKPEPTMGSHSAPRVDEAPEECVEEGESDVEPGSETSRPSANSEEAERDRVDDDDNDGGSDADIDRDVSGLDLDGLQSDGRIATRLTSCRSRSRGVCKELFARGVLVGSAQPGPITLRTLLESRCRPRHSNMPISHL